MKFKIHPALYIDKTTKKGRGVYTEIKLPQKRIIEKSTVLVLSPQERKYIEKTELQHYIFEWGDDNKSCCVAFGYISMYNHSYAPNCEYEMDFDKNQIIIRTLCEIDPGEELTVNYNGDGDQDNELWFEVL